MKKTLLFLCSSVLISSSMYAQLLERSPLPASIKSEVLKRPAAEGEMNIGYCSTNLDNANGVGGATGELAGAIFFPAAQMQTYIGCTISSINIAVDAGIPKVSAFIRSSLTGGNLASSATVSVNAKSWNTITFDTPYVIDGSGIYIGYAGNVSSSSAYPMLFDGSVIDDNAAWLGVSGEWDNYSGNNWGSLYITALVSGNLPENNVTLKLNPVGGNMVQTNTPFSVTGSVANKASNMITSFDVVYKIDDETPITKNIQCNIANGEDISFSIDDLSVSENKDYTFNAEVINLNGSGVDISPEDNVATISFGSYETALPRNVLMEQFTTESCGYCPGFAATLKAFLEEKGHPENLILQAHHSGFYTDNFTTTEDKAYMWFFGGATWAPAIMFDRTNFDTSTPGPVTYAGDLEKWTSMALDVPAFVSLDIDGSYNSATKTVTVKVKGEKVRETLPGESDVRMNVYLQESEVAAINQSNGGKGYKHAAVMRASLTGTWGEKITLPVGEFETKEYTYTIPSSWNADNMKVVAFVSNYNSADHNDSPIYNAKAISFPVDNAVSKVEFATNQLYVTDSKLHINTEYKNGRILNAMGAIVMEFNNGNIIDLNALNEGIYIVNVDKGSKQISSKIVIKH